jgi:Ca-activated chloride channel family protein
MEKDNFQIFENKRLQSIAAFSREDSPVSIGIVLDTSGSMRSKIQQAKEAVDQFIANANPGDEFSLITFSDRPVPTSDFGESPNEITSDLLTVRAKGSTALLDALYLGISNMKNAKYSRKAILIVSDGGDNHSRYSEKEVQALAKEADVMIYAIGIYDAFVATEEERLGPALLDSLSEVTGGRSIVIESPADLSGAAVTIGNELRNLYVLAYRPDQNVRDGKWRKIRVRLLPPKGLPRLHVRAKEGYYGFSD